MKLTNFQAHSSRKLKILCGMVGVGVGGGGGGRGLGVGGGWGGGGGTSENTILVGDNSGYFLFLHKNILLVLINTTSAWHF